MSELFGEGVIGVQQTAFGASRLFGSAMLGQGAFWRDGTGPDLYGITPQTSRPMADAPARSLKDAQTESGQDETLNSGLQPRSWRLWTVGFGLAGW